MKKLSVLVIFAVLLFAVTSVYAAPPEAVYPNDYLGLYLDDGAGHTQLVLSDTGMATFNGALGDWTINVTTAITYPWLGSQAAPVLDLNSVNVSSSSGGTLQIYASASGFDPRPAASGFALNAGGTTDGSVQFKAYWDDFDKYLFWTGHPLGDSGVVSGTPFAASFGGTVPAGAEDYTIFAQIIQTGGGATSFNAEFRVPEPASLMLLGLGLLGVGVFGLRRRHE